MKAFSRYPRDLIFLVCLASLVHLGLWLYGQSRPAARKTFDSGEYMRAAANLRQHGTAYSGSWSRPQDPAQFSKRPPIYPLFIASLRPISKDPGLIAAAQVFLNFLGAWLIWKILSYLGVRRSWRIGVVAFYLLYPAQLIYTQMVMAEILLQLTLLSSFYFLARFQEEGKWHHLALCNLLLGLAALTKPIMVYFWVPNLIYHVWLLRRVKKPQLLFLALIPLLSVTMWSYRNYIHTGYFHFSSIKTSNMLHVNIRGTVRRVEGREKADIVAKQIEEAAKSAESFAEASRTVERAFLETMLKNWKTMITVYMRGTIFFFLDPGRYDLYEFLVLPHNIRGFHFVSGDFSNAFQKLRELPFFVPPYLLLVGSMNLLLMAGFAYCSLVRYYPLATRLFILVMLAYILLIVAPTGLSRFRLSIMPFLFVSLPPLLERVRALWKRRAIPLVN